MMPFEVRLSFWGVPQPLHHFYLAALHRPEILGRAGWQEEAAAVDANVRLSQPHWISSWALCPVAPAPLAVSMPSIARFALIPGLLNLPPLAAAAAGGLPHVLRLLLLLLLLLLP